MPVRFSQGDVARLLRHFNMAPARKGSKTYLGMGKDGQLRRGYFRYHSDSTPVAIGTADAIATQLGFRDVAAMKEYMDTYL